MRKIVSIISLVIVCFLLFLPLRFAFLTELGGTFKPHSIPPEYKKLDAFLSSQDSFSRTLWIPNFQRFSSFTNIHPAIPGEDFYHVASIAGVLDSLKKDGAEKQLQEASVKYVVVPFDSEGEMFLKDRKYDIATYEKTVSAVKEISWLNEVPGFGRIHIFEVENPKDHFWTEGNMNLSYKEVNPTDYQIAVEHATKGDTIIFSEAYDSGWKAFAGGNVITSQPFEKSLNSFVLPQSGNYTLRVYYQPQDWVNIGLRISSITLVVCIVSSFSAYSWFRKSKMVE